MRLKDLLPIRRQFLVPTHLVFLTLNLTTGNLDERDMGVVFGKGHDLGSSLAGILITSIKVTFHVEVREYLGELEEQAEFLLDEGTMIMSHRRSEFLDIVAISTIDVGREQLSENRGAFIVGEIVEVALDGH